MAVLLLKLIFATITTLSNLISRILLQTVAYAVVGGINGLKVPGQAIHQGFEQLGELIKWCIESVLGLILELMTSLISTSFDLLKQGLLGSGGSEDDGEGGGSPLLSLIQKTKESLAGVTTDAIPEIVQSFTEMVTTIISDLWSNSAKAIEIVKESALESSE